MSTLATDDLDEQLRIVSGRIADGDVSDETQALLDNLNRIKEAIAKGAMQSHVEGLETHAWRHRSPHMQAIKQHADDERHRGKSNEYIIAQLRKAQASKPGQIALAWRKAVASKPVKAWLDAVAWSPENFLEVHNVDSSDEDDDAMPIGDTSVEHGKGWTDAQEYLEKDPRFVEAGLVWLEDSDVEGGVGRMRIDPTYTGLTSRREQRVLQEFGKHFFLGPKQPHVIPPNVDGGFVRLMASDLFIRPSADPSKQVLNLLVALAQSGKAAEMGAAMWVVSHILGCCPYMQLRRSGGRIDAETVKQDIKRWNINIKLFLETLRFNKDAAGNSGQGPYGNEFSWLDGSYDKYTLDAQVVTDGAVPVVVERAPWAPMESNEWVVGFARPTCVISLMTAPSMRKMHNEGIFKAVDKEMQAPVKNFSFYSLMGGKHNVTHKGGDGVVMKLHSKYPAKCHNPYAKYDKGINRKQFRVGGGMDEADSACSDKPNAVGYRIITDDKDVKAKSEQTLHKEAHLASQDVQKKRAKMNSHKRNLDVFEARHGLGDGKDDTSPGGTSAGDGQEEDGRSDGEGELQGFQDPAGRTLRSTTRLGPRKSYNEEESDQDEEGGGDGDGDGDGDDDGDGDEGEGEGALISEEERVQHEKMQEELELAEQEYNEAMRIDAEARKSCGEISGVTSTLYCVIATTATSSALMYKHPGVQTTIRLTRMPIPDSYLQHEFMLQPGHPNLRDGYYVETVELPSRPTGTCVTRTELIEQDCQAHGKVDELGVPLEPLKKSAKGVYYITAKMIGEFPWVEEMKARIDTMMKAIKKRPASVRLLLRISDLCLILTLRVLFSH